MFHEDEFEVGDLVTCVRTDGYRLTEGRTYEVLKYEPRSFEEDSGFTWPAYVAFTDDTGRVAMGHATRFRKHSHQQENQSEQ